MLCWIQIVMEQFIRLLIDCGMDPKDVDLVSLDKVKVASQSG